MKNAKLLFVVAVLFALHATLPIPAFAQLIKWDCTFSESKFGTKLWSGTTPLNKCDGSYQIGGCEINGGSGFLTSSRREGDYDCSILFTGRGRKTEGSLLEFDASSSSGTTAATDFQLNAQCSNRISWEEPNYSVAVDASNQIFRIGNPTTLSARSVNYIVRDAAGNSRTDNNSLSCTVNFEISNIDLGVESLSAQPDLTVGDHANLSFELINSGSQASTWQNLHYEFRKDGNMVMNGTVGLPPINAGEVYTRTIATPFKPSVSGTGYSVTATIDNSAAPDADRSNDMKTVHFSVKSSDVGAASNKFTITSVAVNSSYYEQYYGADKLVDGNKNNYWIGAMYAAPYILDFDLGTISSVNKINIHWYSAWYYASSQFDVEVSTDGVNYNVAKADLNAQSEILLENVNARYVRLTLKTVHDIFPVITEVELYGR